MKLKELCKAAELNGLIFEPVATYRIHVFVIRPSRNLNPKHERESKPRPHLIMAYVSCWFERYTHTFKRKFEAQSHAELTP